MNDNDTRSVDPFGEAVNAERLRERIAAVIRRAAAAVPVPRADGTTLLRGRRRTDRVFGAGDRRRSERRKG